MQHSQPVIVEFGEYVTEYINVSLPWTTKAVGNYGRPSSTRAVERRYYVWSTCFNGINVIPVLGQSAKFPSMMKPRKLTLKNYYDQATSLGQLNPSKNYETSKNDFRRFAAPEDRSSKFEIWCNCTQAE